MDIISLDHEELAFLMEVVANGAKEGKGISWSLVDHKIALMEEIEDPESDDWAWNIWAIEVLERAINSRRQAGRDE